MSVLTIDTEAFQKLMEKLETIETKLAEKTEQYPLSEKWLDNQDVCMLLHISKRTLQYYRDNGTLPFSQQGSKIYYKASDVEEYLNSNYNKKSSNAKNSKTSK